MGRNSVNAVLDRHFQNPGYNLGNKTRVGLVIRVRLSHGPKGLCP